MSPGKQLPRLKRIEGQVRGLQQMIENERDCVEVAHQLSAVIAAVRRDRRVTGKVGLILKGGSGQIYCASTGGSADCDSYLCMR